MAVEQGGKDLSYRASGDLSAGQFKFVTIENDGDIGIAGDGEQIAGVQQNKAAAEGRGVTVRVDGQSKLWVKGTVDEGSRLQSIADGFGSAAGTANGTEYGAIAEEAVTAGTAGAIIRVRVVPFSRNVTA